MMLRRMVLGAIGALGIALAAGTAAADWREDLAAQIRQSHRCTIDRFSEAAEARVNNRHIIVAKLICEDNRVFEAFRLKEGEPFEIRACVGLDDPVCQ